MKNKKIYIILFLLLYVFVALVSGIHGFAFFGLANTPILAIMLAVAFEVGQAAVLFSILTDRTQQKKVMPWVLMTILTLVQVMGNVYNCYKYLLLNAEENLKFFKEPLFIWTQLPDAEANVILSYIQGAILPIVALLLTSMVTGFLNRKDEPEEEIEYVEDFPDEEDEPSEEALKKFEEIESEKKNPSDDENASKIKSEEDGEKKLILEDDELDNPEDKANDEYIENLPDDNDYKEEEEVDEKENSKDEIEDKSIESLNEAVKNGVLVGPSEENKEEIPEESKFINL